MSLQKAEGHLGKPAPDFDLATPDGARHNRDGVMGPNGMLIAFICNHCPYVRGVMPRLVTDIAELQAKGIGVACIMSNDYAAYPADAPDRMEAFAAEHGLTAPYLVDEDQSVARSYDAVCTPDYFGFAADGTLQYRGRLDDAGLNTDGPRARELVDAMLMIAETGRGPTEQTPSMGCSIKWR